MSYFPRSLLKSILLSNSHALGSFGELALLFPNTDIEIVMFGCGVESLIAKAKKNKTCLASQPCVFSYNAPRYSGSGSIRILLSKTGCWHPSDIKKSMPDAIVSTSPGLGALCKEWIEAAAVARLFSIPMAIADHNNSHVRIDLNHIVSDWAERALEKVDLRDRKNMDVQRVFENLEKDTKAADATLELNPFMHPGPRHRPFTKWPSTYNGFSLIVVPGRGRVGGDSSSDS